MPELPEVEVVRRGLAAGITGRRIVGVQVLHPRPVRRHLPGPDDFARQLTGRTFAEPRRRGKYLWLPLADGDAGLRFVDQRMFGGLSLSPGGAELPSEVAHIGLDPFDPAFDLSSAVAAVRRKRTGIKRALLDQTLVSGIGNIYADEALWRAKTHYATPTATITRARAAAVLTAATEVMTTALAVGGTSFDSLYVNVNGASGYFDRSLAVYGQEGLPCPRCGTAIRREPFMNRSSFRCPRCQRAPARTRIAAAVARTTG